MTARRPDGTGNPYRCLLQHACAALRHPMRAAVGLFCSRSPFGQTKRPGACVNSVAKVSFSFGLVRRCGSHRRGGHRRRTGRSARAPSPTDRGSPCTPIRRYVVVLKVLLKDGIDHKVAAGLKCGWPAPVSVPRPGGVAADGRPESSSGQVTCLVRCWSAWACHV